MPDQLTQAREAFRHTVRRQDVIFANGRNVVDAAWALLRAYQGWLPTHGLAEQRIEVFAPTLLRSSSQPFRDSAPDVSLAFNENAWDKSILNMCLYVDCLWLPDPLEILAQRYVDERIRDFGRDAGVMHLAVLSSFLGVHKDLIGADVSRSAAGRSLLQLDSLLHLYQPLLDSGAIRLYPALTTYHQHVSTELFGVDRFFTVEEMTHAWPDLYVTEGLLYASAMGASYTALRKDEFHALQRGTLDLSQKLGIADQRLIATLPRMSLPFFESMDAQNLVSVRSNDESFGDFRRLLRELSSSLIAGVEDPGFDIEVQRLEKDKVMPGLKKLFEDVNGTTSLKARLSDFSTDFTAGALGTFVLKADIKEALMGGAATGLAKALVKILMHQNKVRPAASAVYEFHTGARPRAFLP